MEVDAARFLEQTLLGEAVMGVPVAASVFDLDRYYVAVNDAFCALTQYDRTELTRFMAGTTLAPDDEAREAITRAIRGRGPSARRTCAARTARSCARPTG